MNQEPDVACEGWSAVVDADEIVVSVPEKAGQAGHTDTGPHGNQVPEDVEPGNVPPLCQDGPGSARGHPLSAELRRCCRRASRHRRDRASS
jgi:hypothetical protein